MEVDEAASLPLSEVVGLASRLSRGEVKFYAPSFIHYEVEGFKNTPHAFPAISVTGQQCSLLCDHCYAVILRSMRPATSPEALLRECMEVWRRGGLGVLVSGGSDRAGRVPLRGFLEAIYRVKRELGLKVVVHTGLVEEDVAEGLARAEVDAALLDVVGSRDTIRSVLHLDVGPEAFDRSLESLERHGVPIVPHVVAGLHYGELRGELEALKIIAGHRPAAVVIVALNPLPGTPMEGVEPPPIGEVVRLLAIARLSMPRTPLVLGCARPRGDYRRALDVEALRVGVDAIAFPSEDALAYARSMGVRCEFREECCSLVYLEL